MTQPIVVTIDDEGHPRGYVRMILGFPGVVFVENDDGYAIAYDTPESVTGKDGVVLNEKFREIANAVNAHTISEVHDPQGEDDE